MFLVTSGCGSSRIIAPVEDISVDSSASESQSNTGTGRADSDSRPVAPGPIVNQDVLPEPQNLLQEQANESGQGPAPEPVVLALITEAETLMAQQQHQQALNTLERGVRIKPKDPWLWHSMAVVHRQQQNWSEALGLAEKSLALAGRQRDLLFANWQIIHDCYEALGNNSGKVRAREKLEQYAPVLRS